VKLAKDIMSQRFLNIIRHYKKWKLANPDTWFSHCAGQATLENAITQAALSVNHLGKKHPHQHRLQKIYLEDFGRSVNESRALISTINNFAELYEVVKSRRVYGVGDLAIYDAAVRIGAFLNILPDQIYLHAGARIGAEGMLGRIHTEKIDKSDLPVEFSQSDLGCYELEDILCIYKKQFMPRN
jgi:hypothetical protein